MSSLPQPSSSKQYRMRVIVAASITLALVALALAWTVTPLAHALDPHRIMAYEQDVREWRFAPAAVIAIYVVGGLVAAPATLMIGATALLFGAWQGSIYAFAGMLANGIVVYAIGRFAARDMVDQWLAKRAGSRLDSFNRQLARRGFIAVALIRLTPIPYSLQNVIAGASRIDFPHFLFGTAIGILPVIALMAGVATEFDAWLEHPDWNRLLALIGAALAMVAVAWSLKRWAMRNGARR